MMACTMESPNNRRGWMGARSQFDLGDDDGDLCTKCGESYLGCKCLEVRNTPQTSDKEEVKHGL